MYVLGALLLLAVLLGAVTHVVDSVFRTIGLSPVIAKIPVIGANWGLVVSILMMWLLDINVISGWIPGTGSWDDWIVIVANGAVVFGMVQVKDAIISMLYDDDADGGPTNAKFCVLTFLREIRRAIQPHGWTITKGKGGKGNKAFHRLAPFRVQ